MSRRVGGRDIEDEVMDGGINEKGGAGEGVRKWCRGGEMDGRGGGRGNKENNRGGGGGWTGGEMMGVKGE